MENNVSDNQKALEKQTMFFYEIVGTMVSALVFLALIFCFAFRIVSVDGNSMQSTLDNQDRLLLIHPYVAPKHGDIVVVSRGEDEPLIKRVIACGGDTIVIKDGIVMLNGQPLDEPYLDAQYLWDGVYTPAYDLAVEKTVPEGHFVVIGDNRMDSHDSRYSDIGFVSEKDIMGKTFLRIWPLERFGTVD